MTLDGRRAPEMLTEWPWDPAQSIPQEGLEKRLESEADAQTPEDTVLRMDPANQHNLKAVKLKQSPATNCKHSDIYILKEKSN